VNLIGSDGDGPDDALFIMVLLDSSGKESPYTDAIATHQDGVGNTIAVEECGSHPLGEEATQLKNMPYLYAFLGNQRCAAYRASLRF